MELKFRIGNLKVLATGTYDEIYDLFSYLNDEPIFKVKKGVLKIYQKRH